MSHIQLTLPLHTYEDKALNNFISSGNELCINTITNSFNQSGMRFFYLWGKNAVGKTHFLKACINEFSQKYLQAAYIPLDKKENFSPEILENLENFDLICIDNIQKIAGIKIWEDAIFTLFNNIQAHNKTLLIISANHNANNINIKLPDLKSRLNSGQTYQINELNDEAKALVLLDILKKRGLEVGSEVINYLLKNSDRNLKQLINSLNALDIASLQEKRKITIPFLKNTLINNKKV